MSKRNTLLKMVLLAMLVAVGVIISPILRFATPFGNMCPMAHLINIVCAVLLGPWWSLLCAALIGIIRMATMGIPPLALTGAVFGAVLSGVFYRLFKGSIIAAALGEVIGTGIIGAIVSYPVMVWAGLWANTVNDLTWLFYIPSFTVGTLTGGTIALVLLIPMKKSGVLARMQAKLK